MLRMEGVRAGYGTSEVLFGVRLEVHPGEVVALVGRNGAGKTTTLKTVIGLVGWRTGSIQFEGQELMGLSSHRIARLGIGYVPQERRLFPSLTVEETLRLARHVSPEEALAPEAVYSVFPRLKELRRRLSGTLSGGEQQMLAVARALVPRPRLLLLDEPSEGLAPLIVEALLQAIENLHRLGTTILLSEQNMRFVERVATRVYVIDQGEIRYEGSLQAFKEATEVRQRYLMV